MPAVKTAKPIRIPALAAIAAKLEVEMDRVRPMVDLHDHPDVSIALLELLHACHDHLDALEAIGGKANLADMAAAGV